MFPPEIFERIFSHCDGRTLINARLVSEEFKKIVEYLSNVSDVWQWCCRRDIPKNQLVQYLSKWNNKHDLNARETWRHIYDNWFQWQSVHTKIDFELYDIGDIQRCLCISVYGQYIILGFENGTAKVYYESLKCVRQYGFQNVPVRAVRLIGGDESDKQTGNAQQRAPSSVLIYHYETLHIFDFQNQNSEPATLNNCHKFSCFRDIVCGISSIGKITIAKISMDSNLRKILQPLTYVRIYSPAQISGCNLWLDVCTILVNDNVQTIRYHPDPDNLQQNGNLVPEKKTSLQFTVCHEQFDLPKDIKIFTDEIIIILTSCANVTNKQIIELYILGKSGGHCKKLFSPWEIFTALITCMFLYGNTFVIGLNSGFVYFYEVNDWKLFDICKYVHMENVGRMCPVLGIDVSESYCRRTFYVVTSRGIHRLVGFSAENVAKIWHHNQLET